MGKVFLGKSCIPKTRGCGLLLQKGLGTTVDIIPEEPMVPVGPRTVRKVNKKKKKFSLKF